MAYSPSLAKQWYKDLSVEELERKYEELKSNYCFNSKEEQINYIIKNYLYASNSVNVTSTKIALEELLKEKTGKDYKFEPVHFQFNYADIIDCVIDKTSERYQHSVILNYFQNLDIDENEKMLFLIELVQDDGIFHEFKKEIEQNNDAEALYNKYKKVVYEFIIMNSVIG